MTRVEVPDTAYYVLGRDAAEGVKKLLKWETPLCLSDMNLMALKHTGEDLAHCTVPSVHHAHWTRVFAEKHMLSDVSRLVGRYTEGETTPLSSLLRVQSMVSMDKFATRVVEEMEKVALAVATTGACYEVKIIIRYADEADQTNEDDPYASRPNMYQMRVLNTMVITLPHYMNVQRTRLAVFLALSAREMGNVIAEGESIVVDWSMPEYIRTLMMDGSAVAPRAE